MSEENLIEIKFGEKWEDKIFSKLKGEKFIAIQIKDDGNYSAYVNGNPFLQSLVYVLEDAKLRLLGSKTTFAGDC